MGHFESDKEAILACESDRYIVKLNIYLIFFTWGQKKKLSKEKFKFIKTKTVTRHMFLFYSNSFY